jgi:hypothetical protein
MLTKNEKSNCIACKSGKRKPYYFMAGKREQYYYLYYGGIRIKPPDTSAVKRYAGFFRYGMFCIPTLGSCLNLPYMVYSFTYHVPERRFAMKIQGAKITDRAIGLIRTLQESDNSTIEALQESIYDIEELVLNPEADASFGDRLVMMQTLREFRRLLDELRVRPNYKY